MDTTAAQIGLRVLAQDPILGIVVSLDGRFASMSPAQREWLVQGIVRVNRAVFAAHNPTLDELTQGWDSELVSGNSIYLLIDPEGAIEGFSEFRVVNRIRVHGLMLATARTKKVKGEGTFLYEAALRDLAGQGFKICVWQSALEATGFQHRFLAQRMDYETLKGFTFAVNLTTLGTHSVNDGKIQSAYGELFDRRRAEVLRIVGRLPAGAYRLHYGQGTNVDYVKTPVNRWQLGENSLNLRIAGDLVKHLIETLVYNPAALLTRQSDARPFVSPSKIPDKVWINPRKAAWSLDRSA